MGISPHNSQPRQIKSRLKTARPRLDNEFQSARLTRASFSQCFRMSIILSALCFALVDSAFWDHNSGMQPAGFVPPMDDELSDEARVGAAGKGQ